MCLNAVGDLHNNFFVQTTGITANVNVLILVWFENGHKSITCKNFDIHICQRRY